jgi:hypothetical protein
MKYVFQGEHCYKGQWSTCVKQHKSFHAAMKAARRLYEHSNCEGVRIHTYAVEDGVPKHIGTTAILRTEVPTNA